MVTEQEKAEDTIIKPSSIVTKKEVFSAQPRFTIMLLVYLNRKIGFIELRQLLKLTPGNLDYHIRMLENAGYVKTSMKISWRPLNAIEITSKGAEAFRNYAINLKKMLKAID